MKIVTVLVAGLLLAAAAALPVQARTVPPTYVHVVRVTPAASPTAIFALQNGTSSTNSLVIRKIEIINASTQTVTGGQAQYWVYTSTQLTHSAAAGTSYAYGSALATQPSYVTVSTAPTIIQYEGDSSSRTVAQSASLTGVPPLFPPLVVDSDDAATVNRYDSWSEESQGVASPAGPLVLGAGRAIVIEKRQGAASDFTAGAVDIRVVYTLR